MEKILVDGRQLILERFIQELDDLLIAAHVRVSSGDGGLMLSMKKRMGQPQQAAERSVRMISCAKGMQAPHLTWQPSDR
jgi:hypothetical protein